MAFTPDEGSGSTGHSGLAAAKSLFGDSGSMSDANLAKSLAGAEAFKAAAKAGRIALDPEQAKGAIKELERAEDIAWNMRRHAQAVAQPLRMVSSPYARELAAKYHEGGLPAKQAVEALRDVIRLTREGYEFAIKNHQRIGDDSAQTFNKGM